MINPTLDSAVLRQRRWAVCGLVLLLIPLFYAWVDLPLTEALVNAPLWLRQLFRKFNLLGYGEPYAYASLVILSFAGLGIALFPATSGARQLATLARLTWQITLGLLASGILVQIPKILLGRARPELWFSEGLYGFYGIHLDAAYRSFPSGHTITIFTLFFMLWPLLRPPARIVLAIVAGLVALARVILLKHYVSDILAGALLAYLVVKALETRWRQRGTLITAEHPRFREALAWLRRAWL